MRIKLDENLSRHLKVTLMARGHDVETVADEGLLSQTDSAVAAAAKSEGRVIFTLDSDFADVRRFPPGEHPGVVLFRPRTLGPRTVNAFIESFAARPDLADLAGTLVIVELHRIRVRQRDEPADR
jgi:predicted nuclease of predicted toxin-antitoxin system